MGVMRILDHNGDTTVRWDEDDLTSVAEATTAFKMLTERRHLAFARRPGTPDACERIHRFDPKAEEIIWVRQLQGG